VEVDGSQHLEIAQGNYDAERSEYLHQLGLKVLRFDDRQVLMQMDAVVEEISRTVGEKPLP
jgi:very-short-patch-repair endonuclease